MAKGGKREQQQKKRKQESSEEQEEEEVQEEEVQEEDQDGDEGSEDEEIDYYDQELSDRDEQLLERIQQEIMGTEQPLKLTWAAIHKLKQEQQQLNLQMDEEMKKIQDKYMLLRTPISHRIAKIASGEALQKQLYTQHQLTKNLSVNKHKPQAIPGFWKTTLDSVGFISGEDDAKILDHCTKLECNYSRSGDGQNLEQTYTVIFNFSDNPVISNKSIKVITQRKGSEEFVKKQVTPVTFKEGHPQGQSAFVQYFNSDIPAPELFQFSQDLTRAYQNSVFYYFNQPADKVGFDALQNGQEDQEEQDQEQIQAVKPVKKAASKESKGNKNPPLEKPECPQQ